MFSKCLFLFKSFEQLLEEEKTNLFKLVKKQKQDNILLDLFFVFLWCYSAVRHIIFERQLKKLFTGKLLRIFFPKISTTAAIAGSSDNAVAVCLCLCLCPCPAVLALV